MRLVLTTCFLALCSASAHAARLPVLQPDGRIAQRRDPGVAATGEVTRVPHRAVRPRTARLSAKKRTTLSELKRLVTSGAITDYEYNGYRTEYRRDKAFAKRLTGARERDMKGVLAVTDRIAARGALTPSRLRPLFLQLQRNREWWSSGPLLASGARVGFKGSEIVYQYVPGEGLQIHPLANFGKLNGLWKSAKTNYDRMQHLMEELLPLAANRAGGTAWEYYFDFGGGAPPWVSGLAQGTALEAMARAAVKTGKADLVFPTLQRGLAIFRTATPSGVRVPTGAGVHYAQYSFAPGLRIINGFVQSLVGLFDYAALSGDPTAQRLFDEGNARAIEELPSYDTGAWSLYDRGTDSHESNLDYHQLLTGFLTEICERTGVPVYCDTEANFKRYQHEVPGVEVITRSLKAGKAGALRFRLSKIARITLRLVRDGRTVYSYGATLGYGTRSVTITPPKTASEYFLRIDATDLAGNTGAYTDVIKVRR